MDHEIIHYYHCSRNFDLFDKSWKKVFEPLSVVFEPVNM